MPSDIYSKLTQKESLFCVFNRLFWANFTRHKAYYTCETVKPIFDDSNWVYIDVSSGGFIGGSGGSLEPPLGPNYFQCDGGAVAQWYSVALHIERSVGRAPRVAV